MKGSALMSVTHTVLQALRRKYDTRVLEVIAVEAGCRASCNSTWQVGRSLQTVHHSNSDYITAFHLDGWIMLDIYA